jgi:CO/xanthine dehydrogenase Mo-binding subunit
MENVEVQEQAVTNEVTPVQPTEVRTVLLKDVAKQVGMDDKKLRRFLREKKFQKPARQWFWPEGSADLATILENAKKWEKEENDAKAPKPSEAPTPQDAAASIPTEAEQETSDDPSETPEQHNEGMEMGQETMVADPTE